MYMIPQVLVEDDVVGVPIYSTQKYCWIEWKEGENVDKALGRAYDNESTIAVRWTRFKIVPSDLEAEPDEDHYEGFEIWVYQVRCKESGDRYYLIAYDEIGEFDDILNCVCIPYNRLNLLKFYAKYLCPIGQIKFRN